MDSQPASGSDADLIVAANRGDRAALDAFAIRYRRTLTQLAVQLLRNRDDANDAVQEALVKAIRSLPTFDPDRPVKPWLCRICVNCCVDAVRRRRTVPPPIELPEGVAASEPDALHDEVCAAMKRNRILKVLEGLPGGYGRVLYMRHFQGMGVTQIAEELRKPEGTIKSWLFRARALLRKRLSASVS
jgi:RNA polymerase sigma-70 factor (ECF subfamily)